MRNVSNVLTEPAIKPASLDDIVFVARDMEQLSALIVQQTEPIYETLGIIIPVRSCSLMMVLGGLNAASASDIAKELGQSHQLIMQKIPKLIKTGLIARMNDKNDARRKLFYLTTEGKNQLERLEKCQAPLRLAYQELFADIGDLKALVIRATEALDDRPLKVRFRNSA